MVREINSDLNILALVGKQLRITECRLVDLKFEVSDFSLQKTQWDCQVPPNLRPLAQNEVLIALQQF